MADRQVHPQSPDRDPPILFLAASFGGFALDPRRLVCDNNGRLDFIAMLATRAAPTLSAQFTHGEQCGFIQGRGM